MAFGTNSKFTAKDVYKRMYAITEELEKLGIEVVGFSGDGDTRVVK